MPSPLVRRLVLGAILLVAFAVRLAAVLVIEVDPRAHWSYDMTWYDVIARRLMNGLGVTDIWGKPTAAWPPGYPLFLSAVYAAAGPNLLAAKVANVVLGTGTVLVTHLIACELRRPVVGLVAAAVVALFPGLVLFAPLILSEELFVFLFAAALWLFLRWNHRAGSGLGSWLGFGVLLGAISLVRGVGFFLLPVFATTRLLEGAAWRPTAWQTLAGAAGIVLALLPWTVRNHLRLGYPVLLGSDGAFALYVGNSSIATGEHTVEMREPIHERFGALMKLPRPHGEVALVRAHTREALAWMAANPHRVVALVPAKVFHMYRNDLGAASWMGPWLENRLGDDGRRRLYRVVNGYWFAVLGLACLGLSRFLPRDGPGAVALPLTVAWMTAIHAVLFFGSPRFHVPLVPVLAVMAAAEMVAWVDRLRGVRRARTA